MTNTLTTHSPLPATFLREMIAAAILAPSSHNSQPWRFVAGENSLSVFAHSQRHLAVSDVNDRQLHISLGCAITNISVAAEYHGYAADIQYFPDLADSTLVASIQFMPTPHPAEREGHLALSIPARVTNRNKYENRLPPDLFLHEAASLATAELRIDFIREQAQRNEMAEVVLASIGEAMADRNFREELSGYMKSNITKSPVGMPGFGFGFPLPVSLIVPKVLRYVNMSKISHAEDEALLKKFTPLFVVISTRHDDPLSWVQAGQTYERIALRATQMHIQTSIMAAPIQIAEYYKQFQAILKTDFRPQIFFRVGYTAEVVRHSPRIPLREEAHFKP